MYFPDRGCLRTLHVYATDSLLSYDAETCDMGHWSLVIGQLSGWSHHLT